MLSPISGVDIGGQLNTWVFTALVFYSLQSLHLAPLCCSAEFASYNCKADLWSARGKLLLFRPQNTGRISVDEYNEYSDLIRPVPMISVGPTDFWFLKWNTGSMLVHCANIYRTHRIPAPWFGPQICATGSADP